MEPQFLRMLWVARFIAEVAAPTERTGLTRAKCIDRSSLLDSAQLTQKNKAIYSTVYTTQFNTLL